MKRTKLLLIFLLAGYYSFVVKAQSELMMPEISTGNGETVTVDVRGNGFQNIVSAQFGITWDSAVVKFDSVSNFAFPPNSSSGFGGDTDAGHLSFLWITEDFNNGNSLPDSAVIFSIVFDVIGVSGTSTSLDFGEISSTSPIEISDLNGELEVTLSSGLVVVGTDGIVEQGAEVFGQVVCTPNPAFGDVRFSFSLPVDTSTKLTIYDSMGRLVFLKNFLLEKGDRVITISKDIFPGTGIYFYSLQSGEAIVARKFIFRSDE